MHSVYEVIGTREYRGHKPGERFEAKLDPGAEDRAVRRGDIRVIRRVQPRLPAGWRLPDDWPTGAANKHKPRRRKAPLVCKEARWLSPSR